MSATLDEVLEAVKGVDHRLNEMGGSGGELGELSSKLDVLEQTLKDGLGRTEAIAKEARELARGVEKRVAALEAAAPWAGPTAGNGGG